jgi:hypothetical protein
MRIRPTTAARRLRLVGVTLLTIGAGAGAIALAPGSITSATAAARGIQFGGLVAIAGVLTMLAAQWGPKAPRRTAVAMLIVLVLALTMVPLRAEVGTWRTTTTDAGVPAIVHAHSSDDRPLLDVRHLDGAANVRAVVFTPWLRPSDKQAAITRCVPLTGTLAGLAPEGDGHVPSRHAPECRG